MKRHVLTAAAFALAATSLNACARAPQTVDAEPTATSEANESAVSEATEGLGSAPVVVHKSPYCGCCGLWIEHMREAGFTVVVRDVDNISAIKQRVGVPLAKGSCHTAQVGGYFIEGHVPAADIKRLLAEQPDASGLVLPGMPKGSPGMEAPDGSVDPYTVELVAHDGSTSVFARHGE